MGDVKVSAKSRAMVFGAAGAAGLVSLYAGERALADVNASTPATPHVSCTGAPFEILVSIHSVKNSEGLIAADLFRDDADAFLKVEGRVAKARFAAVAPVTHICLTAPGPGNYAVAVYHDRNANLRFDKKAFGLPAEPYGVSNNPPMRFSAPHIDEAKFNVDEIGATVEIKLRNN